ncbi:VOC family protein [Peribacillus cavernae]|uniref:VOC family protein n=1 Tax=Peribacillus cavernae TaxID=1674310 RepID=A0A3S0VMH5_9BACI|nr:VOC family protein [Peribacillus cavernae]MDQ0220214.1 catechol 2,3-dioxygenase-like lactoylglutathione lyase family enzyme [Peribacillus cavernae]RUQ28833.1 VOC family protein [Peribacillus cavernae]
MIKGLYEAHLPVSNMENSVEFYQRLGLELAYKGEKVTFFWIEKERSWLGLWESEQVQIPYHPSIRHVAFRVDLEDIKRAKSWLKDRGISVRESFGFSSERQPLVLPNNPQAHAAIYFHDPDGNSLELISPLRIDVEEEFRMMELDEWYKQKVNHIKT